MTRADRLFLKAVRLLLAAAFIGVCLLCQAAMWLGYVDWWVVGLLRWLTP